MHAALAVIASSVFFRELTLVGLVDEELLR